MKLMLASSPRFFSNFRLTDCRVLLVCLSIGFFVRLVPELLAFPLPIGSDTVYYATVMKSGAVWAHWSTFFTSTWLLNALIVPLYNFTQADPFLLLKVVAPLLYGLNVAGIYWFARKTLGWSLRMGVLASIFFALQLASLRISWDLLRNTLGFGILLFALSYVKDVKSTRGFALFASLSLLSVFAHEYAAIMLFVAVFGLILWGFAKKQAELDFKRVTLGLLPALGIFMLGIGLRLFPVRYFVETNVIGVSDAVSGRSGGLFFLVDYLSVQNSVDSYPSYWNLVWSVLILFAVLYLPYLFLVAKGFFKNGILGSWTVLLMVGAFGCLLVPFSALLYWHRWMFMLVYPFTFYAVNGISKLWSKLPKEQKSPLVWPFDKKTSAMVLLTFYLGMVYLTTPVMMTNTGLSFASVTQTYRYFSVGPNVPYEDAANVVQAMRWLNNNSNPASCVALQHTFVFWGRLYLEKTQAIVSFDNNLNLAAATAVEHNFTKVYFVWWNTPIGWYDFSLPQNLAKVQDFGRISVYAMEM